MEEADEDERDRKLHDSVESLEEEDCVESNGELKEERSDLQQITHDECDEQWTECLEHVTHHTETNMLVVRNDHEKRYLENGRLTGCKSEGIRRNE